MRAIKYAVKTDNGRRRNAPQHGFTLIELLIVMALTAILLVLVFRPLIDSFNLTSRAGTQIESQTAAREILRQVSTALSNAEFIYDNTRPNTAINIWLKDGNGNIIVNPLQFGLVDFVAPGHQSDQTVNPTGPIDPTTGNPILPPGTSPGKQSVSLPLAPGRVIDRFFLGLRDNTSAVSKAFTQSGVPAKVYGNRWSDPQAVPPQNDNRYTLYQAEFLAYIPDPFNKGAYIPNLSLFHTGTNPNDPTSRTDSKTDLPIINDPNFFYDAGEAGDATTKGNLKWAVPGWKDLVGNGVVYYWENWRAVATSILELTKADTIGLDRDSQGNIIYNASNQPTVRAQITFTPSYIENEGPTPASMSSTGAEVSYVSAATFTSQHGAWTTPYRVLVYQNNVSPLTAPATVTGNDAVAQTPSTYYEFVINPTTNATQILYHDGGNVSGDVGPQINANGTFGNPNPQYAFTVDSQRGLINFAFPQWVYTLKDGNGNPYRQQYNPADINSGIVGAYTKRFLSLDDQPSGNPPDQTPLNVPGSQSPLAALFLNPALNDAAKTPQRVHIVPGTEVVFGPDQRPGPHYGYSIQYTRVSSNFGAVGPNQYKINYDSTPNAIARGTDPTYPDANDPRVRSGYIEFDSNPDAGASPNLSTGLDSSTNPPSLDYDPDNGKYPTHSLPLFKAGTSGTAATSATNPAGYQASDPVLVQYNFQMNRASDVVKIDYLTRELMTVAINSRLYDPASASPQDTILTSQIKARNLQR